MDQTTATGPNCSPVAICRVTYRMTDQMGIVYYGNYLEMFEMGRTQLLKSGGHTYAQMESDGYLLPVIHASCDYLTSARYDDLLEIHTWIDRLTRARLNFRYEILRTGDGALVARGLTHHIYLSPEGKPRRIRSPWFERLQEILEISRNGEQS